MSSIAYEIKTVEKMVRLYCRLKHGQKNTLCDKCSELLQYSHLKLKKCPFGDEKGACHACKIHCYQPEMRERMRKVMRFSGPRMMIYYPCDFLKHMKEICLTQNASNPPRHKTR